MKRVVRSGWMVLVGLIGCAMVVGQALGLSKNFEKKYVEVYWTDREAFAKISGGLSPEALIARSPARMSAHPGRELFPDVVSAENQPRYVKNGSNPHQGVDLAMYEGQLVYAVADAQVERIVNDRTALGKMMGQVILNLDLNQDGKADGIFMNYLHVIPDTHLQVGDWVGVDTPIATISKQMPGRYGAHLHFNWSSADGEVTYKTAVFYRHVRSWQFGSNLDVLSNEAWDGNVFYLHGSILNGNNKRASKRLGLMRVELYYQKNDEPWTNKPLLMKAVNGSGGMYWSFDFSTIAKAGDRVRFYVNGIRPQDDQFPNPDRKRSTPYSWAKWPQDLKHPPRFPNQYQGQAIEAYEFVVK